MSQTVTVHTMVGAVGMGLGVWNLWNINNLQKKILKHDLKFKSSFGMQDKFSDHLKEQRAKKESGLGRSPTDYGSVPVSELDTRAESERMGGHELSFSEEHGRAVHPEEGEPPSRLAQRRGRARSPTRSDRYARVQPSGAGAGGKRRRKIRKKSRRKSRKKSRKN